MITHRTENKISERTATAFVQAKLCMVSKCSECEEEVELVSGAIIYGDKWYHNSCWKIRSERNVR